MSQNARVIHRWSALVGSLLVTAAHAQLMLGDGHLGAVTLTVPSQVNRYLRLDAPADLGANTLTVIGDVVAPGDLLLVIQMKDDAAAPVDRTTPAVDLSTASAGHYVWARARSVAGNQIELDAPLTRAFPSVVTQVVVTPEYASLTVTDGGSIVGAPWDGFTGGIVALISQTELINDGEVRVDGFGYRGGPAMPYQVGNPDGTPCHGLTEAFPLGSRSGEGLETESVPHFGRAPSLLGGGGGGCVYAGGAGGSLMGRGGRGGDGLPGQENGGLEPPSVTFAPRAQLVLGGGGGSGWSQASYSLPSASGANGGGIILAHANHLGGAGVWSAQGAEPSIFGGGDWGYGGAGAGGSVLLRAATSLECGQVTASGGQGGRFANVKGPGGGGGGGLVFFEAAGAIACPASALAGLAGTPTFGAMPDSKTSPTYAGKVIVSKPIQDDGFMPTFLSTPNSTAYCGTPYRYSAEHVPVLSSAGPYHFALDGGLPKDLAIAEDTGEITWRPTKAQVGAYDFVLSATSHYGTATQRLVVVVECDPPTKIGVGCGCNGSASLGLTVLALLWLRRPKSRHLGCTPPHRLRDGVAEPV